MFHDFTNRLIEVRRLVQCSEDKERGQPGINLNKINVAIISLSNIAPEFDFRMLFKIEDSIKWVVLKPIVHSLVGQKPIPIFVKLSPT